MSRCIIVINALGVRRKPVKHPLNWMVKYRVALSDISRRSKDLVVEFLCCIWENLYSIVGLNTCSTNLGFYGFFWYL